MRAAYLVESIRLAEAKAIAAVGDDALMQRAAAGLATVILRELPRAYGARVLLVVGPGNNGGDALFAGVRLLRRGVAVSAWPAAGSVHRAGWAAFVAAGGRVLGETPPASSFELVVDGFLGIGGRAGLPVPVATLARDCRAAGIPVVAVDLPSGLDADAPNRYLDPDDSFHAGVTVTFGGLKFCHLLEPARSRCGRLELIDLGLPGLEPDLVQWEAADLAAVWPFPGPTSDKYSRGVVGLETGSARYPGAGLLGALGATYAGAGMVRFTGGPTSAELIGRALPNVVLSSGRVQARVVGSGWGPEDARTRGRSLDQALADEVPLVVDADALALLPPGRLGDRVLLTPHAGELAALLKVQRTQVEQDPIGAVRQVSSERGCAVLLKGATQYLAEAASGLVTLAVPGPAWSAQAGSGDVLAGIAGALLAARLSPGQAGLAAASAQALAAGQKTGPRPPQTTIEALPDVVVSLRSV